MVERIIELDSIFGALADSTRRDILRRVSASEMSVGEIAGPYNLTFAAISKHLKVLEKARLITKQRRGKEHIVHLAPAALESAEEYLEFYRASWEDRLDSLEQHLKEEK